MTDATGTDPRYIGYGRFGKAMFLVVPGLLGAGGGLALHFLLGWLLGLPWVPFQGPLQLLDRIPDHIALPVLMGLGLVARVIFGVYALADELSVTVTRVSVRLQRGDLDRTLRRRAVASVFLDGQQYWRLAGPEQLER